MSEQRGCLAGVERDEVLDIRRQPGEFELADKPAVDRKWRQLMRAPAEFLDHPAGDAASEAPGIGPGQHRGLCAHGKQGVAVNIGGPGFGAGNKGGAQLRKVGTCCPGGPDPRGIGHPARSNDGLAGSGTRQANQGCRAHQAVFGPGQERRAMAASLEPGCNDRIDPGRIKLLDFGRGGCCTDRENPQPAAFLQDGGRRDAEHKAEHGRAGGQQRIDLIVEAGVIVLRRFRPVEPEFLEIGLIDSPGPLKRGGCHVIPSGIMIVDPQVDRKGPVSLGPGRSDGQRDPFARQVMRPERAQGAVVRNGRGQLDGGQSPAKGTLHQGQFKAEQIGQAGMRGRGHGILRSGAVRRAVNGSARSKAARACVRQLQQQAWLQCRARR